MRPAYLKGDVFALLVLAVFPLVAYLEPLTDHRLLGPGDGVALHFPLRTETFKAYSTFSLPFLNTKEFLGTPLLAAYRGGVFYPLTILMAPFDPFSGFQALILISMALAGVLTYLYLKRLGAGAQGAFVAALAFAYGPYLLSHFEDTSTLVAAPMLPLVLMAAESHMNRASVSRLIGLGVSIALLVLAGSPEVLRAGVALLFGRLLLGHTLSPSPRTPARKATALAIFLGLALSAPQWLPTLQLLPFTGRQATGLAATDSSEGLPGLAGLILKTVTHTPAASLALASLPLLFERPPVRVLLLAVFASLALQVGRGPLLAPGALPLVLEFALASLAGLALDEQWRERRTPRGRRLRAYFLVASLASVGVLSVAAATLGGLPDRLAAAVGVFAISLITYFALADAEGEVAAGVFLLPLAVSFALQPTSREVFKDAPTRSQLVTGTPTRRAVDHALAEIGPQPRILTLVRTFPTELALDLGFAGYGALADRVQANGYDPMAPISVRRSLGEMGARGVLTEKSLTPDLDVLKAWSIDAVQVQTADLAHPSVEDPFDVTIEPGSRRVFSLPAFRLKSISLTFADAGDSRVPAVDILARVNGNREVLLGSLNLSAGRAVVPSPSYQVDAMVISSRFTSGKTRLTGLAVENQEGTTIFASRLSTYLSQPAFQEIATTPQIRAFRLLGSAPLVQGSQPVVREIGPEPGGGLGFRSSTAQTVRAALPFLPGWHSKSSVSELSGGLRVEAQAHVLTYLRYTPPLFFAGVGLAVVGFVSAALLLIKPNMATPFLKTRLDGRK